MKSGISNFLFVTNTNNMESKKEIQRNYKIQSVLDSIYINNSIGLVVQIKVVEALFEKNNSLGERIYDLERTFNSNMFVTSFAMLLGISDQTSLLNINCMRDEFNRLTQLNEIKYANLIKLATMIAIVLEAIKIAKESGFPVGIQETGNDCEKFLGFFQNQFDMDEIPSIYQILKLALQRLEEYGKNDDELFGYMLREDFDLLANFTTV